MPQVAPQIAVAQPINDVQLICLVAAQVQGNASPHDAVAWAMDIVAEAVAQHDGGRGIAKRVQALKEEHGDAD